MDRLNMLITKILSEVSDPSGTIRHSMDDGGRKAVGCMLEFCPEEIVYASGALPVGLWNGSAAVTRAYEYFPAFYCAPILGSLELAMNGAYDGVLSAVLVPILCDALKSAGQNWKTAVPGIPMIPFVYPQNSHLTGGVEFLVSEYGSVKAKLEEALDTEITEEALERAIDVYNGYNAVMRRFVKCAAEHPECITPEIRHAVFQDAFYNDKEDYSGTVAEICDELDKLPVSERSGRRVAVTGIMMDDQHTLSELGKYGIAVTFDSLAQESGQIRTDTPEGPDALTRLALKWANMENSSLVLDPEKGRIDELVGVVRRGEADGVIFSMVSFCDPEEYDYPLLLKRLMDEGIPCLYVEFNGREAAEQNATRIQAFAEILEKR
ncbi:MAG: 2-hydroxyacyl-CoA dehydratase family protein [Clostridia bacterium]|nr:2-hydroxyacyl-CoA dehydratase family protein [Clostridia bacterium]